MKYYGITDRGRLRQSNQDSYVIATNCAGDVFAIVCDGIGGGRGGDVASRMTVNYFSEVFADQHGFTDADEVRAWLRTNIAAINTKIFQEGKSNASLQGMGTTLCGILQCKIGRFVVNIGDSRAYGFRNDGKLQQLTLDHTLVQEMVTHGEISSEDATNYPKKNVLTNALGVWDTVRSDINSLAPDCYGYLLCSDGLHGYVSEEVIKSIVMARETDPSLRVRKLIKAALDAGGFDNITIILIDLEGETVNDQ